MHNHNFLAIATAPVLTEKTAQALELNKILKEKSITTFFQPIVNLQDGSVLGYEALSRGPLNSILASPDQLFSVANDLEKTWELDYLCRITAIETAFPSINDKILFINVDPKVLYDKFFHHGSTKVILAEHTIDISQIVFEITEKTAITDLANFKDILENYRSQGYRLALDDVGSGYSGLTLLAQTSPQFIKIDLELIRNCDKDKHKQAIIKALVDFSTATGIKTIGEGIESCAELKILIKLGVNFAQGFFLGKPQPTLTTPSLNIIDTIQQEFFSKTQYSMNTKLYAPIGTIATKEQTFTKETLGQEILHYFKENSGSSSAVILEDNIPLGMINKDLFLNNLATPFGLSIYSKRPIEILINTKALNIDYNTPIEIATKTALNRTTDEIYNNIIITKDNNYYGVVSIKRLLEETTQIELNRARHANPLTGLPGNLIIDWETSRHINQLIPFSAIYIDIDNFKAYNDVYGFEAGDTALSTTAELINTSLKTHCSDYFLGHIGGDDFIVFLPSTKIEDLCNTIIETFDEQAKFFYSIEHQEQKYVVANNRNNVSEKFPLMTISLAALRVFNKRNINNKSLASKTAEIKKLCKNIKKSNFIIKDHI